MCNCLGEHIWGGDFFQLEIGDAYVHTTCFKSDLPVCLSEEQQIKEKYWSYSKYLYTIKEQWTKETENIDQAGYTCFTFISLT